MQLVDTLSGLNHKVDKTLHPGETPEEGNLQGKKVSHWTWYLLTGGAISGGIVVMVCFSVAQYTLIPLGVILAGTNSVGAFQIDKFAYLQIIDEYVRMLKDKLERIVEQVGLFKKENSELKENINELERVKNEFEQQIKNYGRESDKVLKDLEKKTKRLEKVVAKNDSLDKERTILNTKLAALGFKMKIAESAKKKMQEEVERLNELIGKFAEDRELFGDKVDELKGQTERIQVNTGKLDDVSNRASQEVGELEQQNELFKANILSLSTKMKFVQEQYKNVRDEKARLEASIKRLEEQNQQAKESLEGMDHTSEHMQGTTQEMKETSERMSKIKGIQSVIEEFNAFKNQNRVNGQEFLSNLKQVNALAKNNPKWSLEQIFEQLQKIGTE